MNLVFSDGDSFTWRHLSIADLDQKQ